jgi:glycine cleavage system H protein
VLSAFDINVLGEMHTIMATSRYTSTVMAQMALTVQRVIQPHTHRPPGLEPQTVERAATLVGFAGGLMGKVYNGLVVTPSELAAAVIVARVLGAVSEGGAEPAGRVLMDEMLHMAAAGPLDLARAQPLLAGIAASGLDPRSDERTALSRAVLRSFQARFRKLGDMRADPVSLLACLGSDNLVREGDQFKALACVQAPAVELDPELLGCELPADRFYCRGHAWVQPGRDGFVRVGLDDLAAHLVGHIDAVQMPDPGKHLRRGKPALRLIRNGESVEVCSPMNGEVMVVNQSVVDSPEVLPDRPYGDGWLLAMRPATAEEDLSGLMSGRTAREWQRGEARRLSDMFQGKVATAADGATLARDALNGIPGVRWSKVLRKFLKI